MAKRTKNSRTRKGKAPAASEQEDFPQPANPDQRYSPDTPWLAIVNAYGPKGLWLHKKPAPDWQPWCPDLFNPSSKSKKCLWWQQQEPACQLFIFALWRLAGILSTTAIIWGESESLRRQMRTSDGCIMDDRAKFNAYLEAYAKAGFICFLSDAEKEAAERLIFAKQKGQDRTGQDRTEQNSIPPSPPLASDSAKALWQGPGEQDREKESTGHSQGQSTAQPQNRTAEHQDGPERARSQESEPGRQESHPKALEGPRSDSAPGSSKHPDQGANAGGAGRQAAGDGQIGEVVRTVASRVLARQHWDDLLSVAFGCEMHNIIRKNCIQPGDEKQRKAWPKAVRRDVGIWAKLHFEHIAGRTDALNVCQRLMSEARRQVKENHSARNLASVVKDVANKILGINSHPSRAGP